MKAPSPVAILIWLWLCAFLNCAGWGLSALHELNAAGYGVALVLGTVCFFVWRQKTGTQVLPGWRKINRRFRRAFPLGFLILAALAALGGILYAPANYDGLTYRLPRILNWLAEDRWHWIHTLFPRVNGRACGIEWASAPVISLLKTDRPLFLLNIISLLLLPGLIFSVFTRLGVRARAAWHWMWLAPTGYGFLLQAGSIGNDLFGAPFVLAAVDFALRAKVSRSSRDFFASVLAAGLMTSAKTSNLPMLLPWIIAIWPALPLIRRSLLPTTAIGLIALSASALPTLVFNAYYYHGDWAGLSAEGDKKKGALVLRTADNLTYMTLQNLTPPIFPLAGAWNHMVEKAMPPGLSVRLHQAVTEPEPAELKLADMQIEENAGLGWGVSLLLILTVLTALWRSGTGMLGWQFHSRETVWLTVLRWAPWVSLLALLSQSVVAPLSRILVTYYALLLPAFLAGPVQATLVCRRWWRWAAGVVFLAAGILLIITPPRPLFPARTIFSALLARHPQSAALQRAATVYAVYHDRNHAFALVLASLPPDATVLGLFTYDDPEASLWRPFGSRRIEHIRPEDTADYMKAHGIRYVLIPPDKLGRWFHISPENWVHSLNASIIKKIPLELRIADGISDWWLIKLP